MTRRHLIGFSILIWIPLVHPSSQEWNMSELVLEPSTTARPLTIEETLEERRTTSVHAGLTILPNVAEQLCEKVYDDIEGSNTQRPTFLLVTVKQSSISIYNTLDPNCIQWVSRPCEGKPSGQFDPECLFWMPLRDMTGPSCAQGGRLFPRYQEDEPSAESEEFEGSRAGQQNLVLNGLDATSLCAAINRRKDEPDFNYVVMKSDEASELRCINWRLSGDIIWTKEMLSKNECKKVNKYRNFKLGSSWKTSDPESNDDIECRNPKGITTCKFVKI